MWARMTWNGDVSNVLTLLVRENRTWHGMNLCMKVRFEVATKLAQKDVSLEVFQSFHRKLASNAFPFIARPCPIKCIVC